MTDGTRLLGEFTADELDQLVNLYNRGIKRGIRAVDADRIAVCARWLTLIVAEQKRRLDEADAADDHWKNRMDADEAETADHDYYEED